MQIWAKSVMGARGDCSECRLDFAQQRAVMAMTRLDEASALRLVTSQAPYRHRENPAELVGDSARNQR